MEALVAVGLAGNVVQFVQGAGALISLANEIRDSGSPKSLPHLQSLSETLTGHAAVLRSRLIASTPLTEENQVLAQSTTQSYQAGSFITESFGSHYRMRRSWYTIRRISWQLD
jgi:hypothetical protein